MNHPHDDYNQSSVTLKADGNVEKTVVGSVMESLTLDSDNGSRVRTPQRDLHKQRLSADGQPSPSQRKATALVKRQTETQLPAVDPGRHGERTGETGSAISVKYVALLYTRVTKQAQSSYGYG